MARRAASDIRRGTLKWHSHGGGQRGNLVAPYGSIRAVTIGFGISYLAGFVLLAELLGSSADETAQFTRHFDNDASRFGDIAGAVALLAAALALVMAGLVLRHRLGAAQPSLRVDLVAALAMLAATGLLVSAGLLLAVPLWQSFGDITGDPGVEPGAAAGIAQAGTALLICTLFILAAWTAIVAQLARKAGAIGRWLSVAGFLVAVLACFGITGAGAFPLGLWWIVVGMRWRQPGLPSR